MGKIIMSVLQGSILGLVLFNIFVHDLFLFITKSQFWNCTADNSLFCYTKEIDAAHEKLKSEIALITQLIYENTYRSKTIIIGVLINNKLLFYSHIKDLHKTSFSQAFCVIKLLLLQYKNKNYVLIIQSPNL